MPISRLSAACASWGKGDVSANRLGFWIVLGVIVIIVGMIVTTFLSGW